MNITDACQQGHWAGFAISSSETRSFYVQFARHICLAAELLAKIRRKQSGYILLTEVDYFGHIEVAKSDGARAIHNAGEEVAKRMTNCKVHQERTMKKYDIECHDFVGPRAGTNKGTSANHKRFMALVKRASDCTNG